MVFLSFGQLVYIGFGPLEYIFLTSVILPRNKRWPVWLFERKLMKQLWTMNEKSKVVAKNEVHVSLNLIHFLGIERSKNYCFADTVSHFKKATSQKQYNVTTSPPKHERFCVKDLSKVTCFQLEKYLNGILLLGKWILITLI